MKDCIFCKITRGEAPARKIYEDELICAFWDARPAAPIHVLIVPKQHVPTLNDVPPGDPLLTHMSQVAVEIAKKLGVYQSGYRFFINVNRGGGQVVFHLHAHLVAGRDLGTFFITAAILFSTLWQKIANLFRKPRSVA
jgi:histidine triad (HIT) family protein